MISNGGAIKDYEGLDQSKNDMIPMVAVNTTAGTAAEMTRFAIITDTERHVKMAIIDWRITPLAAINDPELMMGMPQMCIRDSPCVYCNQVIKFPKLLTCADGMGIDKVATCLLYTAGSDPYARSYTGWDLSLWSWRIVLRRYPFLSFYWPNRFARR